MIEQARAWPYITLSTDSNVRCVAGHGKHRMQCIGGGGGSQGCAQSGLGFVIAAKASVGVSGGICTKARWHDRGCLPHQHIPPQCAQLQQCSLQSERSAL